jgi:magnesium chelatase family protein
MGTARTSSIVLAGLDGQQVEVSAETGGVPAGLVLSGLPEVSLRETRDRIRAAVINSGESWPAGHLTVRVTPGVRLGHSCGLDLAIAVAVLTASGRVRCLPHGHVVFLGELGLDGALRPVRGVLPAVGAAAAAGFARAVVPEGNAAEAPWCPVSASPAHQTWRPCCTSSARAAWPPLRRAHPDPRAAPSEGGPVAGPLDLADLAGQQPAKRAAEICAAGGHHLLLSGPPGAGATLAERIPGLMPALDQAAALEVTAVHSLAGVLPPGGPLVSEPPLASPHHTATIAAVLGGSTA